MPTANILSVKDNAKGTLSAGISAVSTSLVLQAAEGALFPQPYNGTATSLGSSTTLNCTGISATIGGSAAVGKPIFNATDGSIAFIKSVAANALTTTPLLGGSDNTWQNSDTWRIDEFVITALDITTSASNVETVNAREQMLVIGRSTDTLTVATGGRGYNNTTAQTWDSGDHIRLLVSSPNVQRIVDALDEAFKGIEAENTTNATQTANIASIRSGADFYAVATGSANAYAATYASLSTIATGLTVAFKANFTNSGATTFNYNSGVAVAVKRLDGATALVANDIVSGQVVVVRFDGTSWQMLSPSGNPGGNYVKLPYNGASDSTGVGASSTATANFDTHNYAIPANDLTAGVSYEVEGIAEITWVAGTSDVVIRLGSTAMATLRVTPTASPRKHVFRAVITGTAAAGASVAVRCHAMGSLGEAGTVPLPSADYQTQNVATNGGLTLQIAHTFGTSNAGHNAILKMLKVTRIATTVS